MTTTKAIAVKAEAETQLQKLTATAQGLVPKAKSFVVDNDAAKAKAIDLIKAIKERSKVVADLKDEIVKPQKAVLDALTKKFTGPIAQFKEAEDALKRAVVAYDSAQAQAKAKAAAEAAKLSKKGDADAAHAALMLATSVPDKTEGVSEVKYWEVEVVDKAAVPEQYKIVDEKALLDIIRMDSTASVPGVRFVQKTRLQVKI